MNLFVYHSNPSVDRAFSRSGDAWAVDEEKLIFAVADSPLRYLVRDSKRYPFDDHGYEAADTFCQTFIKEARKILERDEFSEDSLREVLVNSNSAIRELNERLNKSYGDELNYDLAETIGMGAIVYGNKLFYGGLEDCYVTVLRGGNYRNLTTFDFQIQKAFSYLESLSHNELLEFIPEKLESKLSEEAIGESCKCNFLRNNLEAFDKQGDFVGWGCFTGEKEVEKFLQVRSLQLEPDDRIFLLTDGMLPVLDNKDFLDWFFRNVEPTFSFQKEMRKKIMLLFSDDIDNDEKTLIYFKYE